MKKLSRNSALIALSYYFIILLNACCNCKEYQKPLFFEIEKINAENIEFTFEADTFFRTKPLTASAINGKKYGISVNLETKLLAVKSSSDFLKISTSYACKCINEHQYLTDSLTEIHIKTLIDFDATHPAGSNVDEFFKHIQVEPNAQKSMIVYNLIYKTPFFKTPNQVFQFYLNQKPSTGNKIQFEVSLKTAKGKIFTSTTDSVILL